MNPTFMFSGFCRGCNREHEKCEIVPFDYTIKFYFTNSNVTLPYSFSYCTLYGPQQLSRYSDCLQAGRSGDRKPVGATFTAPAQNGSVAPQPPVQWIPGLFPGRKEAGAWR
jgi:hypothetical protein